MLAESLDLSLSISLSLVFKHSVVNSIPSHISLSLHIVRTGVDKLWLLQEMCGHKTIVQHVNCAACFWGAAELRRQLNRPYCLGVAVNSATAITYNRSTNYFGLRKKKLNFANTILGFESL